MRKADRRYLEDPVGVPLVHLEALDGHKGSRVFPIAHVCEPAVVTNPPDAQELLLEKVRGGYDTVCFTDLGEQP